MWRSRRRDLQPTPVEGPGKFAHVRMFLKWYKKTMTNQVKIAWITAGSAIVVAIIANAAGFFKPFGRSEISGVVREGVTHNPIAGAQITLAGRNDSYMTDDNGNFNIQVQGLTSEEVRVSLSKIGYAAIDRAVTPPKRGWVIDMFRQADEPDRQIPRLAPRPVLNILDRPINIDFISRNRVGPTPGCSCSNDRDILFPNGPYNVLVNEEFTFRYDGSPICQGQDFDNFHGIILWDGARATVMAHNHKNAELPGIAGSLKVSYSAPGDYNVNANFSLDCLDLKCRNTCSARGMTQVHVR
jgi:hypothetical protein